MSLIKTLTTTQVPTGDANVSVSTGNVQTQSNAIVQTPDTTDNQTIAEGLKSLGSTVTLKPASGTVTVSYAVQDELQNVRKLPVVTRKLTDCEKKTGLLHDRPEMIAITQFVPLYKSQLTSVTDLRSLRTSTGKFVDSQINATNIRVANAIDVLETLALDADVKKTFEKRQSKLKTQVDNVAHLVSFLMTFLHKIESTKTSFDARANTVKSNDVHKLLVSQFAKTHDYASTEMTQFVNDNVPAKYDIVDLMSLFGFKSTNIKITYMSTKLWVQILREYRTLLENHSKTLLDAQTSVSDSSPSKIVNHKGGVFELAHMRKAIVPTVSDIVVTPDEDVRQVAVSLSHVRKNLYADVPAMTNTTKIAALVHVLAHEYRHSAALGNNNVVTMLRGHGYNVASTYNIGMYDNVIGTFGTNVFTMATMSERVTSPVALAYPEQDVFLFETMQYVQDNVTYVPGSVRYVDDVLSTDGKSFNVSSLRAIARRVENVYKLHADFLDTFDALGAPVANKTGGLSDVMSLPTSLARKLLSIVFDANSISQKTLNDKLAPVYELATMDNTLFALLYMHALVSLVNRGFSQSSMTTSSTLLDSINDNIIRRLDKLTKQHVTGEHSDSVINSESIRLALKNGTALSISVAKLMSDVLNLCNTKKCFVDSRSRYSDVTDSLLMMLVFDAFVTMVGSVATSRIVSKSYVGKTRDFITFGLSNTTNTQTDVMDDVLTRLENERAMLHQTTYYVLDTLHSMVMRLSDLQTYMQSALVTTWLSSLLGVFDGDVQILKCLLSTQQATIVSSALRDLQDKLRLNEGKAVTCIDEKHMTQSVRNAFNVVFGTSDFATEMGYNKKVLTVGVPHGFADSIRGQATLAKMRNVSTVERDIVNVCVYKLDLLNQDLVFQPLKFMFELSRFPVRNSELMHNVGSKATFSDVLGAVPMREFSRVNGASSNVFWKSTGKYPLSALASPTYGFLTEQQKDSLVKNHMMSWLLETYLYMLTGFTFNEHAFALVDADTTTLPASYVTQLVSKVLSQKTSEKLAQAAAGKLYSIADVAKLATTISDDLVLSQRLLSPKAFDRVFNVVIDPDDFVLNYMQTMRLKPGVTALQTLIDASELHVGTSVVSSIDQLRDTRGELTVKRRDRRNGDATFEKYFVTLETFANEEVIT